ncbi:hypothetical protein SSTU70S_00928 [Stutzerimonas stutzeri]
MQDGVHLESDFLGHQLRLDGIDHRDDPKREHAADQQRHQREGNDDASGERLLSEHRSAPPGGSRRHAPCAAAAARRVCPAPGAAGGCGCAGCRCRARCRPTGASSSASRRTTAGLRCMRMASSLWPWVEPDRHTAAAHRQGVEVIDEVADLQLPAPGTLAAAQHRFDAGDQLGQGEGLDQVVVGASLEPLDAIGQRIAGGEHDDRRVAPRIVAQALAHLIAVDTGQHDVQHDQVVVLGGRQMQAASGRPGRNRRGSP